MLFRKTATLLSGGLLLLGSMQLHADINGMVQYHTAARTDTNPCSTTDCKVPFSELRGQVKAEKSLQDNRHSFTATIELIHDFIFDETDLNAREIYWDWAGDVTQVRTGRQMITWGTGDMLFINDIFAKDWNAYFGGMPMDFLKLPTDAIKFDWYPGATTIETVIARFDADHAPEAQRFDIQMPQMPSPIFFQTPDDQLDELEYAAKVSRNFSGWDVSGYASRSYWRSPAYQSNDSNTLVSYPRLNTYGASATGQIQNGVFNLEAGYYHSPEDSAGAHPFVQNSQSRLLTGYSRQVWADATLGVQFYVEHMENYSSYLATLPTTAIAKNEWNRAATMRFTQFFLHQTLTFNLFNYWGLSDSDRFLQSTVRYAFNDNLWGEIGTNIFSGNPQGMFGAFDRNDNIYLTLRFAY